MAARPKIITDSRISSIESFRVVAIIAVICLHTSPFYSLSDVAPFYNYLFHIINSLARFAVPFFFITAGYFFGRKINEGTSVHSLFSHYFKRLSVIFIVWSAIYGVIPHRIPLQSIIQSGFNYDFGTLLKARPLAAFSKFQDQPLNFLMEGTLPPLWFLTALMLALAILTFFISIKKQKYVVTFSVILYLFGLLANDSTYSHTPLGIQLPIVFNTRNGPFFSTLFVTLGWWLSKQKIGLTSTRLIFWLIFGGIALQQTENFVLWKFFKASAGFDYLIGTIPFSVGIFLLAIAKPNMGKNTFIPKMAALTLGIYVSHPLVEPYIFAFFSAHFNPIIWQILFPLILFVFSAAFVFVLKKIPVLRHIVS